MQKFKYLTGKKVGLTTIRKILKRYNLPSRIARKKPFLSKKNISARFFWACNLRHAERKDFHNILWTDEAKCMSYRPSRKFIHCRKKDVLLYKNINPTKKFGKWSTMVWAGISYDYRTPLYCFRKGETEDHMMY